MKLKALAFLGGCLVFVGGCSRYDASVTGRVTIDGKPVPAGAVMFHPISAGAPAYGVTDATGAYSLATGREDGLQSGSYVATVTAREAPTVEFGEGGAPPPPGKAITPPKYQNRNTSGLQYEIAKGANEINIDLKSKP